jgi:1-deoxy-D-xylulose-5-phosphate synthase
VKNAQETFVKEGLNIAHYDMRFAKPLDEKMLHKIFKKFDNVITIEDGCLQAGFGSAILEFMVNNNYKSAVKRLGIPDEFIHHGSQEELRHDCQYDTKAIIAAVHKILKNNLVSQVG